MVEKDYYYGKNVLSYIEAESGDTAKNMEQRMRRAVKKYCIDYFYYKGNDIVKKGDNYV